jgi:hypothetical protein
MAVVTYNIGADTILERAMSTTALDLRCCYVLSATGATAIANIINQDLTDMAAIDALTDISLSTERVALTGEASAVDHGNNRANWDSSDIVFGAQPETAWGAVIYDEGGGTEATRLPVWGMSFASGQPVNGGLTLTVADFARLNTAIA